MAKRPNNLAFFTQCHERWMRRRNRKQESPDYLDDWWTEQCGLCRFFIPLQGILMTDYGACTNADSPFDGVVRFEHDGCTSFTAADDWAGNDPAELQ